MRLKQAIALLICVLALSSAWAQPERLTYAPDEEAYYAILDPGSELLARNLLLTNRQTRSTISFALSFDKEAWNYFGLGPRYSSFFDLQGNLGCYIKVRTQKRDGTVEEKIYFLSRGRCFSLFWNQAKGYWDVEENPCR